MKKNIRIPTNLCAGIFGLLLAGALCFLTRYSISVNIPAAEQGKVNSVTVPYLLTAMIALCSVWLLLGGVVKKKEQYAEKDYETEKNNVIFMLFLCAYVGFMEILGFLIGSLLFSNICIRFLGCKTKKYHMIITLIVFFVWAVFHFLLGSNLPKLLGGVWFV